MSLYIYKCNFYTRIHGFHHCSQI